MGIQKKRKEKERTNKIKRDLYNNISHKLRHKCFFIYHSVQLFIHSIQINFRSNIYYKFLNFKVVNSSDITDMDKDFAIFLNSMHVRAL